MKTIIKVYIVFAILFGLYFSAAYASIFQKQGNKNDVNQKIWIDYKLSMTGTEVNYDESEIFIRPFNSFSGLVRFEFSENFSKHDSIRWDLNGDGLPDCAWQDAKNFNRNTEISYPFIEHGDSIEVDISIYIKDFDSSTQDFVFHTYKSIFTLFQTPDYRFGDTDDFLVALYSEDKVLDNPILIVEGFDPLNENNPAIYFSMLKDFFYEDLSPNGYDIFILNFADGGQDMKDNAMIVLDALEDIYNLLENKEKKISIAGLSMGGVITRYALAYAEDPANNIDHHTGLFLSFDSPQQGAIINRDFQDWIKAQDDSKYIIKIMQDKLKSIAAKQLLRSNTYDEDHSFYNQFYNVDLPAQNGNGYPKKCKNVAISNGSLTAKYGRYDDGKHLLDFYLDGNLSYSVHASDPGLDPGSLIPNIKTKISGSECIADLPVLLNIFGIKDFRISWDLDILYNPVFIQTQSALDLHEISTNDRYDITDPGYSMFDDYYVHDSTYFHDSVTDSARSRIMEWLQEGDVEVVLENIHNNQNIDGTFLCIDGINNSVLSGDTVILQNNTTYTIHTNHKLIDGQNWMHHHWNQLDSLCFLNKTINVENGIDPQEAVFKDYFLSTIQNSLSSTEGLQIHDPWYQDANGNQPDDFCPLNEVAPDMKHEVFLDQVYYDVPPGTPFYTISADYQITAPVHDQTIPWYFQKWSVNGADLENASACTSAVVFRQDNAQVTANYKGHYVSDNTRATGYNNGRRVARDGNGILHLVYEDGGEIWYCQSENNGRSWSKEEKISSSADYQCVNPSIACQNNHLYVAYAGYNADQENNFMMIFYGDKEIGAADWNSQTCLMYDHTNSNDDEIDLNAALPQPSIDVVKNNSGEPIAFIAYDYVAGDARIIEYIHSDNQWADPYLIFGAHPGVCSDWHHSVDHKQLGIAYDRDGEIYFQSFNFSDTGEPVYGFEYRVSDHFDGIEQYENPSISYFDGYAHIVWEGLNTNENKKEVFYKQFDPAAGNTIDSATPPYTIQFNDATNNISSAEYDVISPTIGLMYNANDGRTYTSIYYTKNNTIYRQKFKNGFKYNSETWFGSGRYPSIVTDDLEGCVWTTEETIPYFLDSDYFTPEQPIPIVPFDPNWGSVDFVIGGDENNGQNGEIIIGLNNITYGADTLEFNQLLRTDNHPVSGNYVVLDMDLKVTYININNMPADEEIVFNLNYVEQSDTIALTGLTFGELPDNISGSGERFFKITTIVDLGDRNGHFCFGFNGRKPAVLRKYRVLDNNSTQKESVIRQIIPEQFALHQNYPNPFNPVTHITVDVPQVADVELTVYNINGQKVKELMTGHHEAGIYEVIFDGAGLASGVYLYRLQSEGFVQTKRMLLLK